MQEALALKSSHGAKLVERLLYKVLSEGLLTCHNTRGVVARQRDEEWYKDDEESGQEQKNGIDRDNETQQQLQEDDSMTPVLNSIGRRNLDADQNPSQQQRRQPQREQDTLDSYEQQDTFDYYPVYPTLRMYILALDAWAKSIPTLSFADITAKKKVRRRGHHHHHQHHILNDSDLNMNAATLCSNDRSTSAAKRAQDILHLMQSQYERYAEDERNGTIPNPSTEVDIRGTYGKPPRPDVVCFTTVIRAHQKEGNAQDAEALLDLMIALSSEDNLKYGTSYHPDVRPDSFCFRTILHAWVEYSDPKLGMSKAQQLLQRIEYLQQNVKGYEDLQPDTWMYNTYMQALVQATTPKRVWTAWEARKILETMCQSSRVSMRPDSVTFNIAINAMAKMETFKGAIQAEKVLDLMFIQHRSSSSISTSTVKPNSSSFHTVIKAWARCATKPASDTNRNAVKPSDRAEQLLQLMEQLYEEDPMEWRDLKATTLTYNSVLSVFSHSAVQDRTAAERAESILGHMKDLYEATGDTSVKPNNITYDTVIQAWAKSRGCEAPLRAQQLLEHMYELYTQRGDKALKPGIYTVGSVLHAWSKASSERPDGAQRAQELLEWIQHQHQQNHRLVQPDTVCYLSTMAAWLKSQSCSSLDRVKHTHDLLSRMENLCQAGNIQSRPNTVCYNIVLNACALCRLQDIGPEEAERIVALAVRTCQQLRESKYCEADESTYYWIIKALQNLLPPDEQRMEYFEELFESCRQEGLVSNFVWLAMTDIMPEEWLSTILPNAGGTATSTPAYHTLPAAWRKNAGKRGRYTF